MMQIPYFDELIEINDKKCRIVEKYAKMRVVLERMCRELTLTENIQFSNLFSRLSYICETKQMNKKSKFQIHRFRVNANKVLHSKYEPTEEEYKQDLKALCETIRFFYNAELPQDVQLEIPSTLSSNFSKNQDKWTILRKSQKYDRIRISVIDTDNYFIYATDEDCPTEEPIKIKRDTDNFNESIKHLWKGCQLNLIDVDIDTHGIYNPAIIILEPDYLIDVSSLAECMQDWGKHPLKFVHNKFEAVANTQYILLGNTANLFFDELINEKEGNPIIYQDVTKKIFQSAPIEFSTCNEINNQFFIEAKNQFQNIKNVINDVFHQQEIDRNKAVLEPSFVCEQLGVQGRLDFLQIDREGKNVVIELKSGKAPFPKTDFSKIRPNHQSQLFIYQIMIQKILGIEFDHLDTYVFYSRYEVSGSNLRLTQPYMLGIKEILNIRNLIVANEYKIAQDKTGLQTKEIIKNITPNTLITDKPLTDKFITERIIPQIEEFQSVFTHANPLELAYFHSFYSFVTKEHCLSKVGSTSHGNNSGFSSLWLSSLEEKKKAGEILYDLKIKDINDLTIHFNVPKYDEYDEDFLPNFRQGDIVILYERNKNTDKVTNKQIFKGTIQDILSEEIIIKLRFKQRNVSVLPKNSKYAVEPDFLDSSYNSMYRGLYCFLQANKDRKELLLNQRTPQTDYRDNIADTSDKMQEIVQKAVMAKDYFLLVGPPGTGKTSRALKSIVEELYRNPDNNILLLSYTNRAVDEICDTLNRVNDVNYIRIGSELSCDEKYRARLLDKNVSCCNTRKEVRDIIKDCRIYVGTVASLSGKTEIFKLKHFQVAIVDEASQILEPHIIGILSAKDSKGENAIDKFILIGDHKQLPAVVLQEEKETAVNDQLLNDIDLTNRRNSLFERLYDLHKKDSRSLVWGMLHQQGRMHPAIAEFPNREFYNGQLEPIPTEHQKEELEYLTDKKDNQFFHLIATKRIAFIPSDKHEADKSNNNKVNKYEADIVSKLVQHVFELYKKSNIEFLSDKTIGVITPYRSQIALIRREIRKLNIPELDKITIDTVERFQGSERDIIIYSFSVNDSNQLEFLSSNSIIEDGKIIDRKLNVVITRAKKQIFVTGNPNILRKNKLYDAFIEFIRSKSGYIFAKPEDFIAGKFTLEASAPPPDVEPAVGSEKGLRYLKVIQTLAKSFFSKIIDSVKALLPERYGR
jgi:superfamily I DNA and/or RNA helicase